MRLASLEHTPRQHLNKQQQQADVEERSSPECCSIPPGFLPVHLRASGNTAQQEKVLSGFSEAGLPVLAVARPGASFRCG